MSAIVNNISFRNLLFGSVHDFSTRTGLPEIVNVLTLSDLIVALSNYTEEGRELNPEIYFTDNLSSILKFLPGGSKITIGELDSANLSGAPKLALKRCAPLAASGWSIFVEYNTSRLSYGIFRGALSPLAIPLDRAILDSGSGDLKVARVHQSAPSCVEIANHRGDRHTIFLSQRPESEESPRQYIDNLAADICAKVPSRERDATITVITKALSSGLEASHGALVAVTRSSRIPTFLSDCLAFTPILDFAAMVSRAKSCPAEGALALMAYTPIIDGVFKSDGIVIFNRQGCLLGYNSFIRSGIKTKTLASGGARHRAFYALSQKLSANKLQAIYMRSQDGGSEYKRLEEV